jgi:hypothetical protein
VLARYTTDPDYDRLAVTYYEYDVMLTGLITSRDLYDRSGFVHEAVHIRSDMRGKPRPQMKDEVFSYIVQVVLLRTTGLRTNNIAGARDQRLFPAALAIAEALRAGSKPQRECCGSQLLVI